jgi:HlyD family secretion protein/macrolide-specific efflux system membrane fusion protein
MGRVALVGCLLAAAVAAGWFARERLGAPAHPAAPEGGTARLTRGRLEQNVKARGIVKPAPNALVRVGFPMPKDVARRIRRLTVIEGDVVKDGCLLAELDHDDLKASLKQLEAEAVVVERRLAALRALAPVERRVAEATREQARAQLDQTARMYKRVTKLRRSVAASHQEWEAALGERDTARARYGQAEATLAQVLARFETDIATAVAQLEQARAAVRAAEVQVRWSRLRAPFDAQVFAVHQQQGELTSNVPHAPVLTLLDPRGLQVHLYVDEGDFGRVRVGQAVRFRVDAHPEETVEGRIVRLLPRPILQENVVYYLAVVEPEAARKRLLRAEMTALAHVRAGAKEALWLPPAALRSRADGWFVLRPGPGGPVEVPVRIGWKGEGRVEVREGLAEGDEVLLGP